MDSRTVCNAAPVVSHVTFVLILYLVAFRLKDAHQHPPSNTHAVLQIASFVSPQLNAQYAQLVTLSTIALTSAYTTTAVLWAWQIVQFATLLVTFVMSVMQVSCQTIYNKAASACR